MRWPGMKNISKGSAEKEVIDMYTTLFSDEQIRKAHEATIFREGRAEGRFTQLIDLVKAGVLNQNTAASFAGMTPELFSMKMAEFGI